GRVAAERPGDGERDGVGARVCVGVLRVLLARGRAVTELPEAARDLAARLVGEVRGEGREALGRAGHELGQRRRLVDRDVVQARALVAAERAADGELDAVRSRVLVDVRGVRLARGRAVTEVPQVAGDASCRLVAELH